jgi:hypothetical protein
MINDDCNCHSPLKKLAQLPLFFDAVKAEKLDDLS